MAVIIIVEDNPEIAAKLKIDLLSLYAHDTALISRIRTMTTALAVQKGYLPSRQVTFRLRKPSEDITSRSLTIDASRIFYIDVSDHKVTLHLTDGEDAVYRLGMSLKECEQILEPVLFARCHHSYLVNLHFVREVRITSILLEGNGVQKVLSLSRGYRNSLLESLQRYRAI